MLLYSPLGLDFQFALTKSNLTHALFLLQYIGSQALGFVFGAVGAAFLLENSTKDSQIQPRIRESIRRLIMNSHHELSRQTLAMVQEEVGEPYLAPRNISRKSKYRFSEISHAFSCVSLR